VFVEVLNSLGPLNVTVLQGPDGLGAPTELVLANSKAVTIELPVSPSLIPTVPLELSITDATGTEVRTPVCMLQTSVAFFSSGGSSGPIQTFTVPFTGIYLIETRGGSGSGTPFATGAKMAGQFQLTAGEVIRILVGAVGGIASISGVICPNGFFGPCGDYGQITYAGGAAHIDTSQGIGG
jgi:hypothetical protein